MVVPLGRAVRDAQRRAVLVGLVLTLPIIPCRAVGRDTPGAPPNATDPSKTVWIGQPPDYRFEWGALGGYGSEADQGTYRLAVGLEGRLKAPQFGLLDLAMEGAYGRLGLESGAAFGTYLKIPFIWTGIEYDTEERTPYVRFSLQGAPRRGGLLGRGDRLRLDYTPGRKAIEAGFKMPFPWADYRATRPRNSHVELPKGSLPSRMSVDSAHSSAQAMDRLRHSMTWVDQLLTPNLAPQNLGGHKGREAFEAAAGKLDAHLRLPGHSFAEEDSAYHANLRVVLASAVHDSVTGDALASIARSVLLGRVIVPYNRLFGRIKRPGELTGLAQRAAAEFDSLLRQPTLALNDAERQAAHGVFSQILRQLDDVARASRDRWKSWRLVWIPLNFALAPDQYDTQAEVDSILGALAEHPFSSANAVRYIYNDQFVAELRSSILATRRYHVLWIHDYAGRGSTGGPDQIAWGMAIDGYTEAFVRAIEEMDRGERDDLPEFLILLDEHYYRTNGSAKVLSFLESLGSNGGPKVPGGVVRDRVKAGVARLRSAIAASPSLKRNGEEYVRERVRVHVSITHPYDPTFVDDMIMRDHTKLAFYDVFEEDPGSGQALFTGLGVGEHYVGPHWEDRTLALRGTETVRVKDAARALLLSQGLKPEELPWFLRERPYWDHFGRDCDSLRALGWDADVLTVTNGTGFRSKSASVLKAAIYNLMQRGSVLIIPDSIWTCDYWAAVLVAAALRGCRVFPIAPALENAPSSALPTMGLMRATLWILYRSSEIFGDDIRSAGGMLRVGLYTNEVGVQDVARMLDRADRGGLNRPDVRDAGPASAQAASSSEGAVLRE
jgi:hypothetical protein